MGTPIASSDDVVRWVESAGQAPEMDGLFWVTFVVTPDGMLRIADRRSEHVACAGGGNVLAAGELAFLIDDDAVEIAEASNQSSGFCPAVECWQAVQEALCGSDIIVPSALTREVEFRRCPKCREHNLVKDDHWYCAYCDAELPKKWNF